MEFDGSIWISFFDTCLWLLRRDMFYKDEDAFRDIHIVFCVTCRACWLVGLKVLKTMEYNIFSKD